MGTSIRSRDLDTRVTGYINVDHPSAELSAALAENGITTDDLRDLANNDHVIRGETQIHALFERVAQLERARFGVKADLAKTSRLYSAISAELERTGSPIPQRFADPGIASNGGHSPTGL